MIDAWKPFPKQNLEMASFLHKEKAKDKTIIVASLGKETFKKLNRKTKQHPSILQV